MKINQMNKLIEDHGSWTKLKFLHGKLLEALEVVEGEVIVLHENWSKNRLQMILYSMMIGLQKSYSSW